MRPHTWRRGAGLAATAALALATLAQPAAAEPTTPAKTDDTAITVAGSWLEDELIDGLMDAGGYTDFGLTLDSGFALDQAGEKGAVATINAAFQSVVNDYISGDAFGDKGSTYAGAVAKAATFARVTGANPTSYGGVNLVTRLEERVSSTSPIVGRIEDKSSYGDYANTLGQSFAVRALTEAKSQRAADALGFLLAQQCTSGFFREGFTKDKTSGAQGCAEGQPGSEPSIDATALAVVNLLEGDAKGPAVKPALDKATAWLASQQKKNGSFAGNSNSTGLSGWALGLVKDKDAAARAATWVRKQQPVDRSRCRSALTKDIGAIAYDAKAVKAARNSGISAGDVRAQWRRATAQGMAVLQWASASTDELSVTLKRSSAEAGDKVRVKVWGLDPGERACVSVKGDAKRIVGKASTKPVTRKLTMPTGNKVRVVKVKTAAGSAKARIAVSN
ncbi:terpene cyclase/mutase family protein [Nocardioides piscis]|uniref:Terpene cyclase/mutase family protein n=1 Tax=Nocardioides piscis TaxID=2714938 RepID=A0A6G7YJZ9_9ACTN|nr:terpene cyclase/mutase family protein [Nocardioides piscis]QIK77058.1 terpene cyclase/mutase family protein [Nocardioides piscis]